MFCSQLILDCLPRRFFARAGLAALATLFIPSTLLANTAETQSTSDGIGASSLTGTANWTPATAVSPTNALAGSYDYTTGSGITLRTPANANAYTSFADSLTFIGELGFKGSNVITIPNLILSGGTIQNSGTGGNPDMGRLAGTINLTASSTIRANGTNAIGTTYVNVLSVITNAPGVYATLTVNTAGTVILSGQNTFNGAVTVDNVGGTNAVLQLGTNNALPSTATVTLGGGANYSPVLDLHGNSTTISNLTFTTGAVTGYVTNTAAGTTNTLTLGYGNGSETLSYGTIADNPATAGTVALTKTGTGTLTLVGTNSYSGDTTVSAGTLAMGGSYLLPSGAGKGNLVLNGTLNLAGNFEIVNGLSGTGVVDQLSTSFFRPLVVGSNGVSSIFNGVIQNTSGTVGITKVGAGTLTLNGNSTFGGAVLVTGGQLWITNSSGLGTGTKLVTVQDGADAELHLNGVSGNITLPAGFSLVTANASGEGTIVNETGDNTINGSIAQTIGGGTVVTVNGGTLTLAGNVTIASGVGSRNLTLGGVGNGTVTGVLLDGVSGNMGLIKTGAGTWTLSATNTYSAPTTVQSGTLALVGAGMMVNTTNINVDGGAVFNVSGLTNVFTLGSGQSLGNSASSSATGILNGSLNTGSGVFSGAFAGAPVFTITNGTLTLASSTVVNILNNTGSALATGSYLLVATNANGAVAGTLPSVTVTGGGLAAGTTASLAVSGGQLDLVVSLSTTNTLVLLTGSNPSTYGGSLTFQATVSPVPTNGEPVIFKNGATTLGTGNLTGGVATFTTGALPAGADSITAVYGGDGNYAGSTSGVVTQTVNPASLTITANNTNAAYVYGAPAFGGGNGVTYAGFVNGQTNTVLGGTLSYGGTSQGATNAGTYTIIPSGLTNAANTNYSISYVNGTLTISQATPVITIGSSLNPAGYLGSLSFSATLQTNATGSVVFSSTNGAFSTNTLAGGMAASLAITNLARGVQAITVVYGGDGNYLPGTNIYNQTVTNHPPVATLMVASRTAGLPLEIALSDLATNWSDADGDPVELIAINFTTTNGVALFPINLTTNLDGSYVITNNAWLGYANPLNVGDQISYSISDGQGGTNIGYLNVAIQVSVTGTNSITAYDFTSSISNTVTAYGVPNFIYILERSTNLSSPVWVDVQTNQAGTNGVVILADRFLDLGGIKPSPAFYQLKWQP